MKSSLWNRAAGGLLAAIPFAATALATTLEFDELAAQPVDGRTAAGVTFGFEVGGLASLDATYNVDLGLGATLYTSGPVLEGDAAGVLTLSFEWPTPELSFGLLLLSPADFTPGAVVELYDGATLVDTIGVDTLGDLGLGTSEGLFAWSNPGTPITRAVVDFDDAGGRFAMDNLIFVPEPSVVFGALGVAAFALVRAMRRG